MSRTIKTWLVTGCSSGLGRAIVEEALDSGDRVVVTARKLADAKAVAAMNCDSALPLILDVTDPSSVEAAVASVIEWSGSIDVLVNNAGYGLYGAIEEVSDEEMLSLFQTNVFGVARMLRAVLPSMRSRGAGTVVNIGSIAGIVGGPGNGFYAASKFALEGLSEALYAELKPLGIRTILLEPSGIRTNFHNSSYRRAAYRIEDYEDTAGRQIAAFLSLNGRQAGDPRRIARILRDLVGLDDPPLRLLIGAAAVDRSRPKLKAMLDGIDSWEKVSRSTDYDA